MLPTRRAVTLAEPNPRRLPSSSRRTSSCAATCSAAWGGRITKPTELFSDSLVQICSGAVKRRVSVMKPSLLRGRFGWGCAHAGVDARLRRARPPPTPPRRGGGKEGARSLGGLHPPDRDLHVADVDAAGGDLVERIVAVGADLDVAREAIGFAAEVFEARARLLAYRFAARGRIGFWQLVAEPDREDRDAQRRIVVDPGLALASGEGGEVLDALDHPADHRDVAVELARGVADHRVELGAGAGVGREVAGDADRGVAVDGPGLDPHCIRCDGPSPQEQ